MHAKLAGHRLPLQEMITAHIDAARTKLAAEEKGEEKKDEKVKNLLKFEKKEHGHVPSVKEEKEEYEKKSSVDFHDPDDMDKLASALDAVGDALTKQADSVDNGGEKKQGGEQLATQSPTPGKQNYARGAATAAHQPKKEADKSTVDNPGPATAVSTDDKRPPGGGAKYPAKGVFKTASQSVRDLIEAKKAEKAGTVVEETEKSASVGNEAVDFILDKVAEFQGGGLVLSDDKAGNNPMPAMVPGRSLIQNKDSIKNVTKKDAKSPRKAELTQVLTEPAMSKAHDPVVQNNLRNASKGGVKIAAAKAYLQKIAEEGCTCGKKGECRHCKLAKAIEAKKAS
jgi:hypothetical protein